MLSIRNAEPNDFEDLKAFMVKEFLWNEEHPVDFYRVESMLLLDDDMILGFAFATLIDNKPYLSEIYIPEKLRGHLFGDSLLRGLLYYFLNRGFETACAHKNTNISEFLIHEGFSSVETHLELILEDFFNQKCRGCREQH